MSYLTQGKELTRTIASFPDNPQTQLAGLGLAELGNKDDFEAKVLALARDTKQASEIRLAAFNAPAAFRFLSRHRGDRAMYNQEVACRMRSHRQWSGRAGRSNLREKILRTIFAGEGLVPSRSAKYACGNLQYL